MDKTNRAFVRGLFFAAAGTLGVVVAAACGAQQYTNVIWMMSGALWYAGVCDICTGCLVITKENVDDG